MRSAEEVEFKATTETRTPRKKGAAIMLKRIEEFLEEYYEECGRGRV